MALSVPLVAAVLALAAADVMIDESAAPVHKVLSMIDETATEAQQRLDAAVTDFEEFSQFCDKTVTEKVYSQKRYASQMDALSATIEETNAKIAECQDNVEVLGSTLASLNGEMAKAKDLRTKEHEDYISAEKELMEAVSTLETISKEGAGASFAQMKPEDKKQLTAVKASLRKLIEAGLVSSGPHAEVASFLEAVQSDDGDAALDAAAAEAGVAEEPKANPLQMILEKTQKELSDARRNEMTAKADHDMSQMSMKAEISSKEKEIASTQQMAKSNEQALAQAQKDLSVEKAAAAEEAKYLAELKRDCLSKTEDFEVDYKETAGELKGLAEAKAILSKGVKAAFFIQQTKQGFMRSSVLGRERNNADAKAKALKAIQQLGQRLHKTALVSLAYSAAADPMSKVRTVIEQMLQKLQQEAAEEATQEAFCNTEMSKSTKSKDEKEQALELTDARIEKATSAIAELSEAIGTLSGEVAELDETTATATALRKKEAASFAKAQTELTAAIDATQNAYSVLREVYERAGASLLQKQAGTAVTESTGGQGILSMMQYMESDFSKQLSDGRSAETVAKVKYDELMTENKKLKAVTEAEIKGKQSEVKSLKSSLSNYNEDQSGIATELKAVDDYLQELKPSCDAAKPLSYAAKKAIREEELAGLREALKMLE